MTIYPLVAACCNQGQSSEGGLFQPRSMSKVVSVTEVRRRSILSRHSFSEGEGNSWGSLC